MSTVLYTGHAASVISELYDVLSDKRARRFELRQEADHLDIEIQQILRRIDDLANGAR